MRSHLKKAAELALLAGLLPFGSAFGQSGGESNPPPEDEPIPQVLSDGVPRIWSWGSPKGNASSDARFRQLTALTLAYTGVPGGYPLDGSGKPDRSGYAMGQVFGDRVHTLGLTAGRIALFVNGLGWGNQKTGDGSTAYLQDTSGSNSRWVSLYHHESDALSDSDPVYNLAETPWLNDGIDEVHAWVEDFIDGYNAKKTTHGLANIDRIHQDQEPQGLEAHRPGFDFGTYWTMIKADSRWNSTAANGRIPGYPGQTLSDIWTARPSGVPDISSTSSASDKDKWRRWYSGVLKQAESAALEEAVFAPLRTAYSLKGSDYDGTLRLDGGNSGDNSYLSGGWYPTTSGMKLAWDGKGDLQALQMYGVTASYGIEGTPTNTNYVWPRPQERSLDDGVTYGTPYTLSSPESILDASIRQHRYTINACARSFSGAYKDAIITYHAMPGQFWIPGGWSFYNATTNPNPIPAAYSKYFYRLPDDGVRRLLMLARSRNVQELVIWNETFYVSKHGNVYELNTDNPYQWNRFKAMVDQVWKYTVATASVNAGSTTGTAASLATGPDTFLEHTVGVTTDSILTATFANTYGSSLGLRFNVEAESSANSRVSVEVQNGSGWLTVDLDPTSSATDLAVTANKRVAVTGRILHPSSTFSGTITARVKFTGATSGSGNRTVKYDLFQVAADDDTHRKAADFEGDGDVDLDDVTTFENIFFSSCHTTPISDVNHDSFVDFTDYDDFLNGFDTGDPIADLNQDGFVDFTDMDLFAMVWDAECVDPNGVDFMVDLNFDGKVDIDDYVAMWSAYTECAINSNCPAATFE